jgi:Mrp family chromosome partitioning ATPase
MYLDIMGEKVPKIVGSSKENGKEVNEKEAGDSISSPSINRRSALGLLAALGSAGLFATPSAADEHEPDDVSVDDDRPVGTEALLQLIEDEYGDLLTDEDIAQLEEEVASNRESARTLRDFDLANGDDMAMTFRAYRGSY